MRQILIALFSIALLAACGPALTPEPTLDVDATISAMSGTIVAGTLTAQPTATVIPTDTLTPTPLPPTETPVPSETPTPTKTLTPQVFLGCFAPVGVGHISVGLFRIENNTKETLRVYLNGVSFSGDKVVNCSYIVTTSFNTEIIFGNYNYSVQIGTKRTKTGNFVITNTDKTTMRVFDNKVVVVGP